MKIIFNTKYIYSLIIAYMLSFLAFLNLGNEILNVLGLKTQLDTIILYVGLVALEVLGLIFVLKDIRHFKIDILFIFLFFALSYFASAMIYPDNAERIFTSWSDYFHNPVYLLFIYSLPGYYFVRQLNDYKYFYSIMKVFSYIVVVMSVIVFFFAKGSSASQYMTFSYNMLIQLFFLIIYKPKKLKLLHYIVVGFGVFVFVFGGARGAMLSLIVAGLIMYFLYHKSTIKNVVVSIAIVTVGVLFSIFKNFILAFIANILKSMEIDSRTFEFLLSGELLSDSNRSLLYELTVKNITVPGKGVMSDRVILDSYPHNLFLEFLIQYGYILGLILIVAVCLLLVFSLFNRNNPEFFLILLLLPCGFFKLMLTGSYLNQEPAFYILLGICVNSILRSSIYANTNAEHSIRSGQYREDSQADS